MSMPLAHQPPKLDDRELAQRAVAGDGHAFAELYDRHEQRVYGFCMRLLGSPHDAADATQETFVRMLARLPSLQGRELNFVAYALTAARNACYDTIEGRRRAEPASDRPDGRDGLDGLATGDAGSDVTLDPERTALLASAREDVRVANAALPPRQREVLALREIELLSYEQIGEIMGLNRNAVAQLVSRARIKLRDLLRGSALASVSAASEECTRALPLLAQMQDGEEGAPAELDWLRAHLAGCDTCRLGRAAMEEAGVSYRALAPIVPAVWLRHASIARAAEFVGADWSKIAGLTPHVSSDHGDPSSGSGEGVHGHKGASNGGGEGARDHRDASNGGGEGAGHDQDAVAAHGTTQMHGTDGRSRRRIAAGVGVLGLCLLLGAIFGLARDSHAKRPAPTTIAPAATTAVSAATTTTTTTNTPAPHRPKAAIPVHTRTRVLDTSTTTHTSTTSAARALVRPHTSTPRAHRHRSRAHKPPAKAPTPPVSTTPVTTTPSPTTATATVTTSVPPPSSTTTTQSTSTSASTTTSSSSETTSRETIPGRGPIP
jgi:RNA polymerase sigma-70 factor (ECF subfamily)